MLIPPKVYIVGAGPGDPSLITQRGLWILGLADVVLYDALVHPTLLTYVKKTAHCHFVGKRKGHHSATQTHIHELFQHAWDGSQLIVRLKGGDPVIFGRLGEEIQWLHEHNIPFEIIPGVSSGIGVPGTSGIPLTHRDLARSVAFVTGTLHHKQAPLTLPIADTLVFFMGVSHLSEIVNTCLKQPPFTSQTPISILSHGTLASRTTLNGTLETIIDLCHSSPPKMPALCVVGDVAKFATLYPFTNTLPLLHQRVVLTRALSEQESWYQDLILLGAEVLKCPMIEYCDIPVHVDPRCFDTPHLLIFTSKQAIRAFFTRLASLNLDHRALAKSSFACVGEATAAYLLEKGFKADYMAPGGDCESLLSVLSDTLKALPFILPQSQKAGDAFYQALLAHHGSGVHLPCYTTVSIPFDTSLIRSDDWLTFTSPSCVESFVSQYPGPYDTFTVFSIGKTTSSVLRKLGFKTILEAAYPKHSHVTESMLHYVRLHGLTHST